MVAVDNEVDVVLAEVLVDNNAELDDDVEQEHYHAAEFETEVAKPIADAGNVTVASAVHHTHPIRTALPLEPLEPPPAVVAIAPEVVVVVVSTPFHTYHTRRSVDSITYVGGGNGACGGPYRLCLAICGGGGS